MIIYVDTNSEGKGGFVNVERSTYTSDDIKQVIKDTINSMYPITKECFEFKTLYGFRGGELYVFSHDNCPLLPYSEDDFGDFIIIKGDGLGNFLDVTDADVSTYKFGQAAIRKTHELLREIGYWD